MKTNEDFISDLIYKAESGKHIQFQFLRSWQEYSNAKKIRRTHILLVSSIKQSMTKQFKRYCRDIALGNTDIIKLIAYQTTANVLRFYEEELRVITDMIVEYECYLANGNWLDFFFGHQRPIDKLWDHRSL